MNARPSPVWSTFGERKKKESGKRARSVTFVMAKGRRREEAREAREERAEEEQGGGGAASRELADARGAGERGVLRPTPRSMLSSEVPVGGGCAEFPAVERRTPVFFSPRVNPFSASSYSPLLLLLLLLLPFLLPRLFRHGMGENSESAACAKQRLPLPPEFQPAFDGIKFASGPIVAREEIRWSVGSDRTTAS